MTDWFFYQERGQTLGPVTLDEMRARVRDGRLRAFDLIYKEGESSWKMAMEHADLRDVFREAGTNVMAGRPWVCLRRKGEESFEFITDGPFSDDEVRSALAAGRLGYSDYVWRDGFTDWMRIGAVETFNPRAAHTPAPKRKEPTAKEMLSNIVELKRAGLPEPAPPPPEADGADLAHDRDEETDPREEPTLIVPRAGRRPATAPPPPPKTKTNAVAVDIGDPATGVTRVKVPAAPPAPPKAKTAPKSETKKHAAKTSTKSHTAKRLRDAEAESAREIESKPTAAPTPAGPAPQLIIPRVNKARREDAGPVGKRRDWIIVAALVVAVAAAVAFFALDRARRATPKTAASELVTPPSTTSLPALMPPARIDEEIPPAPSEPEPVAAKPPSKEPAPEPSAGGAAAPLRLSVQTSGGERASIDVRSGAPADTPIYVQVVGFPGHVADGPAFYKYLRVSATGSLGKALDLSSVKLGQGSYRISVDVGGEHKETTLDLGVGENKFRQAVGRQRKLAAAALWAERLRLYSSSAQLDSTLQKTALGKSLGGKILNTLDQVKKTTGEKYLFFDEWWELKQIVEAARKGVTAELQARAKKAHDHAASLSVWRNKT